MNAILKRMFEDDDCSIEEAMLKAAILGKTYDQCKEEWDLAFRKEFILADANIITNISWDGNYTLDNVDNTEMFYYNVVMRYTDDIIHNSICKCHNVEVEPIEMPHSIFGIKTMPPENITIIIKFWKHELDAEFISKAYDKMTRYYSPSC